MFRFAHPEHLYALLVLPVILLLYLIYRYQRRLQLKRLADEPLFKKLASENSNVKPAIKMLLFLLALASLILAWANPQIGSKLEEVKREGVDIVIALDVSNSMKAQDIKPNRLERAKQSINRLIDRLENDRIGIIVFAGQAYVQLPITSDYAAAKLFLNTVDTDIIPTQGTAIGAAIDLAGESFVGTDNKHKALIIITDGENHEDDAASAARTAAEKGITIHCIGFGSPGGAPIPVFRNGVQVDFLKDRDGNTVLSKIDESTLEQIAIDGKGVYIRATNADDGLNAIMNQIGKMEKKSFGTKQYTDYEDRFQYFLVLSLFFFLLEALLSTRRSRWIQKLNLFGEEQNQKIK